MTDGKTRLSRFHLHFPIVAIALCLFTINLHARTRRIVVIKADGLPQAQLDRFVAEPRLPNIKRIFYEGGARLQNFYVRGISNSAPSWSLLDTGQHLQIKGNVEYDRYTGRSYDYLNFFPFYVNYVRSRRVDKIGVEVLDDLGIPLLQDAFDYEARVESFQLFQRGARWTTPGDAAKNFFTARSVQDIAAEWAGGLDFRGAMTDEYERRLIAKLNDPRVTYLDCFTPEFDHTAHLHRDRVSLLLALRHIDVIVGRIWAAIEKSPMAAETALILVSDHGLNTDERVYSQGYDLVSLFSDAAGGGHRVVTKGRSNKHPTALMDLDGNEQAQIHLRSSDLNLLDLLLRQLKRSDLKPEARAAATAAFFDRLDRNRARWAKTLEELQQELIALRRHIQQLQQEWNAQPNRWSKAEEDAGLDKASRRIFARLDRALADERDYSAYARTLANLLALRREGFDPKKLKIEDLIAPGAMGEPNSIYDLQNYVAGPSAEGLSLAGDGSLDWARSFRRVNYFSLLGGLAVRNNVQPGVSSRPVDFIAARIPREAIAAALGKEEQPHDDEIWLYGGEERQALILTRCDDRGDLQLRYLPAARLTQDETGAVHFNRIGWQAGLPLKMWEDDGFRVADRNRWLNDWHGETDWLRAIHATRYSNAPIGLHEQLIAHPPPLAIEDAALRRFRLRQRRLTQSDLLVLANDHWNFNVRDFNAGGNHGSFFRASTHATLMFAGGARTGIPKAARITEPYDSLSFVPTIFALLKEGPGKPSGQLRQHNLRPFPGRVIQEIISP
ncbi:MAG: alkaline phosphatase family protein [Blastocatellia bacterium]